MRPQPDPGQVERIVRHGPEAEVVVRTGELTWIVSLVAPAVEQLDLSRRERPLDHQGPELPGPRL